MEKILKYIDENYHETIDKGKIENLLCCSQRNGQRLFKKFFNETISNFKKRLKLENAYKKLVFTNESIKNIAYDVGYETQSSFTKAFINHFKITPSEARKKKEFLFESFIQQNESYKKNIDYEIVHMPSKVVYYKMIITNNYRNDAINRLWDSIDMEINDSLNINHYGIILDQPLISSKTKCRYEACLDILQSSPEYLTKSIFGMKYLKFIHLDEFDLIEDTYRLIFHNWIYHLNYEIDNSPIIEHYIKDKEVQNKDEYRTEIYVPII